MSDILIKGMEMPTEEQSVITINIYSDGVVTCYDDDVERKAVPVPPHGRLGDLDVLVEKAWDADTRCGYVQVVDVGDILDAPTIIEADAATTAAEGGNMKEVKIVMDDYGLLYAILPDGSKRAIRADIFGNPYYGIVRVAEEPKEET